MGMSERSARVESTLAAAARALDRAADAAEAAGNDGLMLDLSGMSAHCRVCFNESLRGAAHKISGQMVLGSDTLS